MLAAKSNWKTSSDKSFRFAIDYWSSSAFFNPVFQSPSGTRRSEKENSFRSSKTCCWCIRKSWCPKKKTKSSGSNFKANGPKSDISSTSSTAEARMMDLIVGSFDILVRRVCKSETRAEETRDHRSLSEIPFMFSRSQSALYDGRKILLKRWSLAARLSTIVVVHSSPNDGTEKKKSKRLEMFFLCIFTTAFHR